MKILPKQVRFYAVGWRPWRRGLSFVGRANTVQVLETALVIEGYLQRLRFPLVDMLFRQALSEWTTVTIPYSRIVRYRPRKGIGIGVVPLVLLGLTCLVCGGLGAVLGIRNPPEDVWDFIQSWTFMVLMGFLLVLMIAVLIVVRSWGGDPLVFEQADGRHAAVSFRIKPRALREQFAELLRRYRRAAARGGERTV